jgi:iron complex outermembrane receptor protein
MKKNTLKQILQPCLALAGALLLSMAAAFAEPEPSPSPTPTPGPEAPQVLPETVVTAKPESLTNPSISSRREQIDETVGAGEIIDAETYKRGRSTTLKDALDFAPGVFVQPRFGAEEARISIRGSGIQRTFHGRGLKLLQDGIPINLADGSFDFQVIEPLASKAVEVFRGSNGLEYGATTLGGALNFISYTGYDAPLLDARFEFGSFNTYRAQLASGDVVGPFDYYVSLTHFSTDGYREHSSQNNQRLFANLGWKFNSELETRFYVAVAQTDSELPGSLTAAQLEEDPTQAQRVPPFLRSRQPVARFDYVTSNWKRDYDLIRIANKTTWQIDDNRLSIGGFWSRKDLDHPILFVIDQLTNDFGVSLRNDYTGDFLGHKNSLIFGFSPTWGYVNDSRFVNDFGERGSQFASTDQFALNLDFYLQEQFWINSQWAVCVGSQLNYVQRNSTDNWPTGPDNSDSQSWWGVSPKAGFLYQPVKEVQFYTDFSRSFEPPSFGELVEASNGQVGLVQLDAQTGSTIEIGTRGRFKHLTWDLCYYYSWMQNELMAYEIAPGLTQTVNADDTRHQGVEFAANWDIFYNLFTHEKADSKGFEGDYSSEKPDFDRVLLRVNYLWNNFAYVNDSVYGNNLLPGIPEHYIRAELLYEHPCGFYIGPNFEYVPVGYSIDSAGTVFTDSYALLGAKIGWRSPSGLSAYFEVRNIVDTTYTATSGVVANANGLDVAQFLPGDGRGFYFGVEYRW